MFGKFSLADSARQLAAARKVLTHLAEVLDARISVQLWDGSRIPLGRNPDPNLFIAIRGPGVIGSLLRWPTLDNLVRQYATGNIEVHGGDMVELFAGLARRKIPRPPEKAQPGHAPPERAAVPLQSCGRGADAARLCRRPRGPQRGPAKRAGLHPVPLRPRQRLLRAVPRSPDAILLRLLHRLEQLAGAGPAGQAGDDLPQAPPAAGRAIARHRLRLGRTDLPRGPEVRRAKPTA